jgi:serine protease Do
MARSVWMACFVAATLFSGFCSAQTIVGPSGKPLQPIHRAKCSQSPAGCYEQATRDCRGGPYQILHSESHPGGLLIDILPGPVTWYTMSYVCGRSDGKIGAWTVAYLEVGNLNGCRASAQFPDQTVFQMVQIQSGTDKAWIIFISNPRWNASIGQRKELQLQLVTDLPTTKPWPYSFSISGDNKVLSTTDASVEFMNSIADASKVEIKDNNGALWATVDMKDSAAAIRAIVNCVREHPPKAQPPEVETTFSGTGFFVAQNQVVTNNHVVSGCTKAIQVRYPERASYTATISGQDATNDLALLHTEMPPVSVASFRFQPLLGEAVATYGFPYSDVLSPTGNFTLGNITALSGMKNDTRRLQTSTPIQPGNSGGPLLDMSGRVIGVVVAQLDAMARMQTDRSIPQNVNFAIQSSIVINFLAIKGVTPNLDNSSTGAQRPPSEVADMAKKFTVQIYCQGAARKTATGTALSPSDVVDFGAKFDVQPTPGQGSTRP